jgi:hypothetical protein
MIKSASKTSELQHFLKFDAEVVATQIACIVQFSKIFPERTFGEENLKKIL